MGSALGERLAPAQLHHYSEHDPSVLQWRGGCANSPDRGGSRVDSLSGKAAQMKILVTGFGKFPGARKNPTAGLARALGIERARFARLGIQLESAVLPVHYAGVGQALARLDETLKPDAILHFGLAARRKFFSVETRALNRLSLLRCDSSGACAPSRAIIPGAPHIARVKFPCREIEAAFRRAGLRCRLSINAGSYICNEALYLSLARSQARAIGFIHVPRLKRGNRPRKAPRSSRPGRADLVRAALMAILLTVRNLRARGPILDAAPSAP
jgi:pyroglutamyl-peptidase